jgi:hypothetical protein
MMNIRTSKTRFLGITTIVAIFAMSFMSASFANTGKVQFLVSKSIDCSNFSFCGGPTYIQTLGVTLYADHTFTAAGIATQYNAKGHVAYSETQLMVGTWKVVSGYFVITGKNTTTVVMGTHATVTISHFSNQNTNQPATPATLDCAQIVGVHCPAGVTASEIVVKVS